MRAALERLSVEQPFLVSAGYAGARAEIRYWDESVDVEGALAQALRLWREHEQTAGLPPWRVVGIEVVDRDTARRRWETSSMPAGHDPGRDPGRCDGPSRSAGRPEFRPRRR